MEFSPGQNAPLRRSPVEVVVQAAAGLDISALLLNSDRKVRSDADLIFFNNPVGPGVAVTTSTVTIDPARVPADVAVIAVTASLDGTGATTFGAAGPVRITVGEFTFTIAALQRETAVICVEIYRRGDEWKVRAVGQGWDNGLAGLATDFGVDVEADEPAPPVTPPTVIPSAAPSSASPARPPASAGVIPGGAMQSDLFSPQHAEVSGQGIQKQNAKMVRVGVNGEILVRSGSMVAYQGNLQFQALGAGGIGRAIRQHLTGEGVPLMKVTGQGDLFLANAATDVHLVDLDGSDGLTVNGANVLAFDPTLQYNVERTRGAGAAASGFFNCVFRGVGRIALTTEGHPVVLTVDQATYADPQAAVAWSASLRTSVKTNDQLNLGTLIGRSTGERFTLQFSGQGFVIVQPSEQPPGGLFGGAGKGDRAGSGLFG